MALTRQSKITNVRPKLLDIANPFCNGKSGATTDTAINIRRAEKTATPETRALSSMKVESAMKAKTNGKPNPTDTPKIALMRRKTAKP
jgi:hypothetical protein